MRSISAFTLIAILFVFPSSAFATTIDFEAFSDLELLTNQISGLSFSNAIVLTDSSLGGSLNEIDFPPTSGANVISDDGGPITISFASPVDSFQAFITHGATLSIRYFDVTATLLGETLSNTPNFGSSQAFSSLLSGISTVTILGNPAGGSLTLDDLSFETRDVPAAPVPEPASLLLVGGGLSLFIRRRLCQPPGNRKLASD